MKLKITPSFQATFAQKRLDVNSLTFGDYMVPGIVGAYTNVQQAALPSAERKYFDLTTGLLVNYNKFYLGASVWHLNRPDVAMLGTQRLDPRINVYSSYNFIIKDKTVLQCYAQYDKQMYYAATTLGANIILARHILLGAGHGTGGNTMFNAGYRNNYISAMVGYNAIISKLAGNSVGAWTAAMSFSLRKKDIRQNLCAFEAW